MVKFQPTQQSMMSKSHLHSYYDVNSTKWKHMAQSGQNLEHINKTNAKTNTIAMLTVNRKAYLVKSLKIHVKAIANAHCE